MAAMQVLVGSVAVFLLFCVQQGSAISCYECNSNNDTRCALDVVPDALKITCPDKGDLKYTMCRKIKQVIEFEVNGLPPDTRTIRGCGWDESSHKGKCYQRSGFGGRQEVCSCLSDYCNGSQTVYGSAALVPLLVAAALSVAALNKLH